ncbi:MAG: hypothetical protein E6J43_05570 [Chloroflexi bacterium]|nr:MAG: hypothetical protein E6J43_05570 [Chloroflexota bacterium]
MRTPSRILSSGLLVAALGLAAACGGGGDKNDSAKQTSAKPAEADLLVSNPSEALGASAGKFEDQVDSVEGQFTIEMKIGEASFAADGTFAYKAPDSVHMTMNMSGAGQDLQDLGQLGQFEVLILGDHVYVNTSYSGWMTGSLDDFPGGAASLKDLRERHSPFDYRSLVDSPNVKVENLGDTTVFDKTYTRLRITTDLKKLMEDVAGSSIGDNSLDPTLLGVDFSSPVTMDILVDPATLLPFTLEANTTLNVGQESMEFAMKFKFFDYNGRVDIPEAPKDAKPFDQAFGGSLFGDSQSSP